MAMRRALSVLGAGLVTAGAMSLGSAPVGGQAACSEPYSPLATAELYPAQESLPAVDADVVSVAFDTSQNPVDMDGDGADDTQLVDPFTNNVRVTRSDGVLDIDTGAADFVATDGLGDLDGDGRDELSVIVSGGAIPGVFVVPGATPPGQASIAATIRLRDDGVSELIGVDDGSGRLLVIGGGETEVLDGSEVMAVGAPGDATGVTGQSVTGDAEGKADLGGSGPDLVVLVEEQADRGLVTLLGDETLTFTTSPETWRPPYVAGGAGAEVLAGPDGVFVTLASDDRSGATAWMWSWTRPCGPLLAPTETTVPATAPVTPPTAPPAAPVAADARFTG